MYVSVHPHRKMWSIWPQNLGCVVRAVGQLVKDWSVCPLCNNLSNIEGELLKSVCVSNIDDLKLMFEIQNTFYEHLRKIFWRAKNTSLSLLSITLRQRKRKENKGHYSTEDLLHCKFCSIPFLHFFPSLLFSLLESWQRMITFSPLNHFKKLVSIKRRRYTHELST